jgi:hypothetical protein
MSATSVAILALGNEPKSMQLLLFVIVHAMAMKPGGYRQRSQAAQADVGSSHLVTHLLREWAWGGISAPQIQLICQAARADGTRHPDIDRLANIGAAGTVPHNCHRDMSRMLATPALREQIFNTRVPMKNPTNDITLLRDQAMLLPHEVFACIYAHYPAIWKSSIIGEDGRIEEFWNSMQTNPNFDEHPVSQMQGYRSKAIPLSMHGDGVPVTGVGKSWSKSVDVFSWSSMLGAGCTLDMHFYIYLFFANLAVKQNAANSMAVFWKILVWSFEWLGKGLWPTSDHLGRKFRKGSSAAAKAGSPLADGFVAVLWLLKGDLDYYAKTFHLAWYTSRTPCCLCPCNTSTNPWTDFRSDRFPAPYTKTSWRAAFPEPHHILLLPGVSILSVAADIMHVKHMGTDAWFYGSVMCLLCYHVLAGDATTNLAEIWGMMQDFYKVTLMHVVALLHKQ